MRRRRWIPPLVREAIAEDLVILVRAAVVAAVVLAGALTLGGAVGLMVRAYHIAAGG